MVGLLWEKNLEVQCGVRDWTACVVTCFLEGAWIGQNLHSYQLYTVDSPVAVAVGQTSGALKLYLNTLIHHALIRKVDWILILERIMLWHVHVGH